MTTHDRGPAPPTAASSGPPDRSPSLRRPRTADLTAAELDAIRELLDGAFRADGQGFSDDDWRHALGGVHAIVEADGRLVAHAAVVPRFLDVAGVRLRTGYLEAVATRPGAERRGYASLAVGALDDVIRADYELGALSTGVPALYARLGWEPWRGSTWVRSPGGLERTADDDGGIMILRTPASPPLDLDAPIACDWRTGDVW